MAPDRAPDRAPGGAPDGAAGPRGRGYRPYSYLRPGVDFPAFDLVGEFDRVPPYDGGLSAGQRTRADRLTGCCGRASSSACTTTRCDSPSR